VDTKLLLLLLLLLLMMMNNYECTIDQERRILLRQAIRFHSSGGSTFLH